MNAENIGIHIFPNPFDNKLTIELSLSKREKMSLSFWDVTGKQIATISDATYQPGKYDISLETEKYHLLPGVYFIKVKLEDNTLEQRVVKL